MTFEEFVAAVDWSKMMFSAGSSPLGRTRRIRNCVTGDCPIDSIGGDWREDDDGNLGLPTQVVDGIIDAADHEISELMSRSRLFPSIPNEDTDRAIYYRKVFEKKMEEAGVETQTNG